MPARMRRRRHAPRVQDEARVPPSGDSSPGQLARVRFLVFWCGAVMMGLEIAGSRLLAPHFGNSVFIWGGLITVFLAAMSCGNYVGGWLADHTPRLGVLSTICMGVAVWVAGLAYVANACCSALSSIGLSDEVGPLVASLVLFLPPSVGLGAVTPFAIRLAASSVSTVGKVSGSLAALSSLGSILGTFVTTFILIPIASHTIILIGLGISLLVAAAVTRCRWRTTAWAACWGAAVAGGYSLGAVLPDGTSVAGDAVVFVRDTPYHNIAVIDRRNRVRELKFDRFVETAIELRPPHRSVAGYTDYFHLAFVANPAIRAALFIGAGGGVGPRTFAAHDPSMRLDVVDIDPTVLDLARSHFFLDPSPLVRLIAADGRSFLRDADDGYDCIVLDAFTIGGRIPFHLCTREFFELCRLRLGAEGVFVMNINSALTGPSSGMYRAVARTLAEVFEDVRPFALGHAVAPAEAESRNIVFVARCGMTPLSDAEWRSVAAAYSSTSCIDNARIREMVEDSLPRVDGDTGATVLTDDYCPIEAMRF